MRIAFDLDDTLTPSMVNFPLETRPSGLLSWFFPTEPLRLGTRKLMQELSCQGHELWIYTTSLRSPFEVKMNFRCYGIHLGGVINGKQHEKEMAKRGADYLSLLKYPPAFKIDLLVDNCEGVLRDAQQRHFALVHVNPGDETWVDKILAVAQKTSWAA